MWRKGLREKHCVFLRKWAVITPGDRNYHLHEAVTADVASVPARDWQ